MIDLAIQLVDRRTCHYDPADLEDINETRLREMLDAKVKGEAVEEEVELRRYSRNMHGFDPCACYYE